MGEHRDVEAGGASRSGTDRTAGSDVYAGQDLAAPSGHTREEMVDCGSYGDFLDVPRGSITVEEPGLSTQTVGYEVWLHVYDLDSVTGRLNEFILRGANLGAFHCGVEVLDDEWSYQGFNDAWDDDTLSGVVRHDPRMHPAYIYKESVYMGECPLVQDEIDDLIDTMMASWPANAYHFLTRNCVSFAKELISALRCPEEIPGWVRGAVDVGNSPAIFPIADYGWSWFKWWSRRQAELEREAEQAAAADEAAQVAEAPAHGEQLLPDDESVMQPA